MIVVMSTLAAILGMAPHNCLQHHLPWLAMLARVMGLDDGEPHVGSSLNDRNG